AENFGYKYKSNQGDTARVINEVVWNGEIDTLYVQRGPLPEEPWSEYPRRGTDCDSNYIADEGVYLARLEVDEFADPGFGADDTLKLESTKAIVVDRSAPYVKKLELWNIWPGGGGPDTTIIRKAKWIDHPTAPALRQLEIETQNPMSLDTLEVAITFDQTMCRDSLQIKYRLQKEGGPAWAMNIVRWDSIVYPDDAVVARSAVVWTGTLRSVYAGEYVVEVRGYDTALNRLDADPSTKAQRGVGGAWEGYEEGMRDTPPWTDCNHSFVIERWRDVLLHMDVSASVTNPETGGWASSAYHMADSLLARIEQDHIDSGRADMWRAGVTRYFGHTDGNSWAVQLLADVSPNIESSRIALQLLWVGTPCSSQGEPLDSVVAYLEDPGNHSMPRQVVLFTDGEMNRGVSRAEQEELWVRAATDSTFGCGTFLYAIMPEAKAHLSEGMCAAVVRSGGSYLTIPEGDMIAGYPGGVLYEDLVHNSRIYGAQGEGVVTRSTHWFRVDGLRGSLFLLGSWAPWGLQLAQGEVVCGGLPRCGECGGEGVTQDAEAPVSKEEAPAVEAAGMSTRDAEVGGGGEADDEEEAREDGMPRLSMTLYDAEGASVPPTGTIGGSLAWWELSPTDADTGLWRVEVSGGSGPYDLRVSERGGVRIELAGKRLAGVNMGCDVKVCVESEWPVQSPSWSLVDGEGATVAGLSLFDDGLHGDGLSGDGVWGGALAGVAERGLYRVRLRGEVNGRPIERVTGEGLWVTEPEFEFLTPAGIDTVEGYYLITWADSSEFAAQIGLYYDTDSLGADGVLIEGGIEEDADGTGDEYLWNTLSVPEGRYWVYAVIVDMVGPGRVVYSPGNLVLRREYPAGWPAEVGGVIRAPVTVADLDGDGTAEVVVGALDSLLYAFQHDGTHRPGFPVPCQGAITAGVAVGDVDGDGLKEIMVATGDYLGPAWVWVLDDGGNVKTGWPVMTTQGTKGTPLVVNLVGPANSPPEIVVAGYDSLVNAWTGDGSPVPGWPVRLSGMIQNSSPVGGDIDWDGQDEVVVTRTQGEPMTQGAIVAIETDGTIKWEKAMPSYVWSTPVLWDVDRDRKPEVIVVTSGATGRLYALNGENGSDAPGWSGGKDIGQGSWASPAVGYLNQTDEPRIVVVNGQGRVRAYSSTGDSLANWGDDVTNYLVRTAPVIADIDGDMMTEILLAARYRLYVLAGATGDTISLYTKPLETDTYSTVGVADLDGDGDLEIVAADGAVIRCWDIAGSVWAAGQEWPQFKRDEGKTGRYRESASPQAPAVETIEVVGPDSLRIRWGTVHNDVYGRPEWLRRYRVYRGSAPYQATWGTQVGLVNAPDTTLVELPGTVNDPTLSSYYRVRAEDLYGNQSALSDETVGEFERSTGAAKGKEKVGATRR
ncbi:hypothetical protein JXA88_11615, partial [Candidatus Fermentibacteria bacterium]|nr:hypothetical protein [Candidatus Fermentibacteria bacterium]